MSDGYFEKPSAPENLVLPIPISIPRRDFITKGGTALIFIAASGVAMEGCPTASQWVDIAIANLPTILQVVAGIVAIAGDPSVTPQLETEIKRIAGEVTKDLNTAKDLISQYKTKADATLLDKIDASLIDAQRNLGDLLKAFHVSNPALMATIAASIGLAITTVIAVQATVPAPAGAPAARRDLAKNNGSNAIRRAYNFIVAPNYPNAVI